MNIIIETQTKENPERVFGYFKKFCIENLQEFELKVENLNFKQEKKISEEKRINKNKQVKQEKLKGEKRK